VGSGVEPRTPQEEIKVLPHYPRLPNWISGVLSRRGRGGKGEGRGEDGEGRERKGNLYSCDFLLGNTLSSIR